MGLMIGLLFQGQLSDRYSSISFFIGTFLWAIVIMLLAKTVAKALFTELFLCFFIFHVFLYNIFLGLAEKPL